MHDLGAIIGVLPCVHPRKNGKIYAEARQIPSPVHAIRPICVSNFATVVDAAWGPKGLRVIRNAFCKDAPITDG